jgi:hypothetical protein
VKTAHHITRMQTLFTHWQQAASATWYTLKLSTGARAVAVLQQADSVFDVSSKSNHTFSVFFTCVHQFCDALTAYGHRLVRM